MDGRTGRALTRGAMTMVLFAALAAPAVASPPPAVVKRATCSVACGAKHAIVAGSTVRLRGRAMSSVRQVTFLGRRGTGDNVTVASERARIDYVDVIVPPGAVSGRVMTRNADGTPSRPSATRLRISGGSMAGMVQAEEPAAPAPPDVDTSDRIDAHVDARTSFFAGRAATLSYVVTGGAPVDVSVSLLGPDGGEVRSWSFPAVAPGVEQKVRWFGRLARAMAKPGRYRFRVQQAGVATAAAGDDPQVVDSFRFLDHTFPVRGRHDYGSSGARFGAGRAGHTHQGQDVMAACGTPLVAARGGRVVFKRYHALAGNYVVIRGAGNGLDYVYMHLASPALVDQGDRVKTGQRIGDVGQTGDARGCHLHFELWSRPGWYEGGEPFDPLAGLRAWDARS